MESLARISSMLETARDLTLEAAQAASASGRRKDIGSKASNVRETKKLLNSRMDREVLEGLRNVIATMSRGGDCSEFFADVVKNVASPILEIKKLVYIYLLRYAESEPDLALLSINTIQKALNDQNQLIRALAIRVMSGIRVPVISQIVALAIKKCVMDMSAYVRKSAALAIPKCYRLDPSTLPLLTENLSMLLGDRSYYVVGAAVMAFLEVCPDRLDLVHKHYRSLCQKLIDMDEWGQLAVLRLLTIYARKCFPLKTAGKIKKWKRDTGKDADANSGDDAIRILDPDLELFLDVCPLLLHSRNSAVIVAIAKAFRHLAPPSYLSKVSGPLVSLLRASIDIQHMALINIVTIAVEHPSTFAPYATHFFIQLSNPSHIWKIKLEVLTLIFPYISTQLKSLVLSELEYFAKGGAGYDKELVKESVRAIGRCAQSSSSDAKMANRCLRLLLRQIESPTSDPILIAESLTVIRHIIQHNPSAHHNTVIKLAKALDVITNPAARANIIWLIGEFAGYNDGNTIAADTLRVIAKNFHKESEVAKSQIVLCAAKVYIHYLTRKAVSQAEKKPQIKPKPHSSVLPGGDGENEQEPERVEEGEGEEEEEMEDSELTTHPIPLIYSYILLLSRYDTSYDIRDRARLYKSLLSVPTAIQLASLLLLAPKPTPMAPSPSSGRVDYTLGSAALFLGPEENVRGYEALPEWVEPGKEPGRAIRDAEKDIGHAGDIGETSLISSKPAQGRSPGIAVVAAAPAVAGAGAAVGIAGIEPESLDEWLASTSEEEEEDDDDDDDEDEDNEDEDEDEDESGDEQSVMLPTSSKS